MKIFAINQNSFGIEHVVDVLTKMGHIVTLKSYLLEDTRICPEFDTFFEHMVADKGYDIVFTFNYFPVISVNCKKYNIKYIAWVYDSPHVSLFSYTILNPCNYVFIFDREMYMELKNSGISTVYYLPLATDTDEYDTFVPTDDIANQFNCDVSFVGSLYNEKHCLYNRFDALPPYAKGYVDSLVQTQSHICGYFMLEDLLTPEIVEEIQKIAPYTPNRDGVETPEYVYAHYFMARKSTEIERCRIIKKVSDRFDMKLYTSGDTSVFPNVTNMGAIDYYDTMPYVFKCSKINLNITLKSIRSGIPLRAFDIMGAGGFLLSNYQSELPEYFIPGEDLAIYENDTDLLEQIAYYLAHDKERIHIAQNGYKKVKAFHSFQIRLTEIMQIIAERESL